MISLKKFEKNPASIKDYYLGAIQNPKEFARSINFNEDLADSGVVILVLVTVQAIMAGILGGMGTLVWGIFGTYIGFVIGAAIGSVIVFGIGKIASAELNFLNAFNIVIHSWLLTFPISLVSYLVSFGFMVSTIINVVFFCFVLISIFNAVATRVYIVTGIIFAMGFVPMACFWIGKTALENSPEMQEVLNGRTLEQFAEDMKEAGEEYEQAMDENDGDVGQALQQMEESNGDVAKAMAKLKAMQDGAKKAEKILPPCYKRLADDDSNKNPIFSLIGVQVQFLGIAPPDVRAEAIEKINEQIDKATNPTTKAFPLTAEQSACLKEVKASLSQF